MDKQRREDHAEKRTSVVRIRRHSLKKDGKFCKGKAGTQEVKILTEKQVHGHC